MRHIDRQYVSAVKTLRRNTAEVVVVAFVLALGINLISSAFPGEFALSTRSTALIGAGLILFGAAFLLFRLRPASERELRFEGVLALGAGRVPEEIKRYELSEKMKEYLIGLSAENKALAKLWRESHLGIQFDGQRRTAQLSKSHANQLLIESLEYFVLDKLSLHLSAYFDSERDVDEDTVVRVRREDIPHVLLQNRFLELFSKPMEMREAFMSEAPRSMDAEEPPFAHQVVFATGKDGAVFDRFELILPKGSRVMRSELSGLCVETGRFRLSFYPEFFGTSTVLPSEFEELYLGREFDELDLYGVSLRVRVSFSWWAFMTSEGWDHFEWLDSFLDELSNAFSFAEFLERINWETALSVSIVERHAKARKGAEPVADAV